MTEDNCDMHDLTLETVRHWVVVCKVQPGDRLYFTFPPELLARFGLHTRGPITAEFVYHAPGTVISGEHLAGVLEYETA